MFGSRTGHGVGVAMVAVLLCAGPASAMSGGTPTPDPDLAPWMATLAVRGDEPLPRRASCGGALIAPDRVATAAHCLDGVDPAGVEVHVGVSRLSAGPGVVRGIRRVWTAPGYALLPSPEAPERPELSSARDDLAVLTLDAPVRGTVPLRPVSRAPRPGTPAAFYGHGITAPDSGVSDPLRRGRLTVRTDAPCAGGTPAVVHGPSVLCATGSGAHPAQGCFGDSGGPLVVRDAVGRSRLAGIFSFAMETAGKPCGAVGFNAFADVAALR